MEPLNDFIIGNIEKNRIEPNLERKFEFVVRIDQYKTLGNWVEDGTKRKNSLL